MKIGNDQKLSCSSCMVMVITLHNFKILSFLWHGCHIPQLQSNPTPAMAFSLHNFTNLLPRNFFGSAIPLNFYFLYFLIMAIIILYLQNNVMKKSEFLHVDASSQKLMIDRSILGDGRTRSNIGVATLGSKDSRIGCIIVMKLKVTWKTQES